jgi:EAL domain-containing protein (putative c-di-GMP-specific phosphodiesterase class I)
VLQRVLAGETVSLPDRRYTVPGVRSGWIWAQYHPHRDARGRIAGVVGLVHEVTDRVRAEEEGRALAGFPGGLRGALDRGEVSAFYQPVVSLATGRVACAEALARWRHPQRGWLSPAAFIAAAEATGLIVALGERILEEACHAAAGWPDETAVSVNLAARQLAHPQLVGQVRGALEASGLPPARLRLEVTESVLIADPAAAAATLGRLRDLGVRVWMDDFGTGYSSLSLLHRLPVDGVKVDRSFVGAMGGDGRAGQVVAAVLGLARALGVETVAEGVERSEQLFVLRTLGCGWAQGFLFAPALEPDAFTALLGRGLRW